MTTLSDLLAQRSELEAQIAAQKPAAIAQVCALMADLGVTIEDLGGMTRKARTATSKRPIKYHDTQGNTWTGVGQRPRWLVARLAAGASLDDFKVR